MGLDTAPTKKLQKQGHNSVLVDCFINGLNGVVPAGSRQATVNKFFEVELSKGSSKGKVEGGRGQAFVE